MPGKMWRTSLLACAVAISGCATLTPSAPPQVVAVDCPRLSPPPPAVMVEQPANFLSRLLIFLSPSPPTPTSSPKDLVPVSQL